MASPDKDLPVRRTEGAPHPFGYKPPEIPPQVNTKPLPVFLEEYEWVGSSEDGPSVLTPEELIILDISNPADQAQIMAAIDAE